MLSLWVRVGVILPCVPYLDYKLSEGLGECCEQLDLDILPFQFHESDQGAGEMVQVTRGDL